MTAWAIPAVTISAGSTTGWAVVTPARARVMTGFRPADEQSATVFEEMMSAGDVVVGRRTIEQAGYWGGEQHGGVPIFVPTHQPPLKDPPGQVRFVTDGLEVMRVSDTPEATHLRYRVGRRPDSKKPESDEGRQPDTT
jgi:hypothetical protein